MGDDAIIKTRSLNGSDDDPVATREVQCRAGRERGMARRKIEQQRETTYLEHVVKYDWSAAMQFGSSRY